jgi:hypothetical protein
MAYFPWYFTDRIDNDGPTILRCDGNTFTQPLPSNDKGMHTLTDSRVPQIFSCCVNSLQCERLYRAVAYQQKEGYILSSLYLTAIGGKYST